MTSITLLVETSECKQFRCLYLKNKTFFLNFFLRFSNLHYISNIFKRRRPSYLMYFRNYRPRKTCLDKCLNAPIWEDLSTGDMVNRPKHWFNLNESAFIILSDHCEGSWVANVTLRDWKFFTLFLNTLTADDKYSFSSRDKWMQTIQLHLSQKQTFFLDIFSAFFESSLNFEFFQKKMTLIAYVFPKLPTTKDVLR